MDLLPQEILTSIASQLPSPRDVSHFRLTSHRLANAAFPVLVKNIHVMNTVECLSELDAFQSASGGLGATKHLTIHHGTWPLIASPARWTIHPLRLRRESPPTHLHATPFQQYSHFLQQEASRDVASDSQLFLRLLRSLPTLNSLTISHIYHWKRGVLENFQYDRLKKRMQIMPCFRGQLDNAVTAILPLLTLHPRISELILRGILDPSITETAQYGSIIRLEISSLLLCEAKQRKAEQFLCSFPSLEELDLTPMSDGPLTEQRLSLRNLEWPRLSRLKLAYLWVTEAELFDFVRRHGCLKHVDFRQIMMFEGTWESFFMRVRDLPTKPIFRIDGWVSLESGSVVAANAAFNLHLRTFLESDRRLRLKP